MYNDRFIYIYILYIIYIHTPRFWAIIKIPQVWYPIITSNIIAYLTYHLNNPIINHLKVISLLYVYMYVVLYNIICPHDFANYPKCGS